MNLQDAHIGIQVEDLDQACQVLGSLFGLTFAEPIAGWPITFQGRYRYTHHDVHGLRVEMANAARPACERWATTGRAAGVSDEFNLSDE